MTGDPGDLKESARRGLEEVGYEERLVGYQSSPAMGNMPLSLYSLREVLHFLAGNDGSLVNYVDLKELGEWVDKVLGDEDLRLAIERDLEAKDEYQRRSLRIAQVIGDRIAHYESILSA